MKRRQEESAVPKRDRAPTGDDYRDRIYERYATIFQDGQEKFDESAAWRWGRAYRYHLRGWLPEDTKASILDAACGRGTLLYFHRRSGYQYLEGVDISPEQVQLARQVTANVHQRNVLDFLEGNQSRYDLITAFDIIEHFHKPEVLRFLDACFGALKPGGRLILQTPNSESPWGAMHRYADFTHEIGFNCNSLSRLLAMTGFTDIEGRETGPVPWGHTWRSSIRYVLWRLIHFGCTAWNLVETGAAGSGVFTRVFLISGLRPGGLDANRHAESPNA